MPNWLAGSTTTSASRYLAKPSSPWWMKNGACCCCRWSIIPGCLPWLCCEPKNRRCRRAEVKHRHPSECAPAAAGKTLGSQSTNVSTNGIGWPRNGAGAGIHQWAGVDGSAGVLQNQRNPPHVRPGLRYVKDDGLPRSIRRISCYAPPTRLSGETKAQRDVNNQCAAQS